jgi:hypothetical protein
MVSLWLFVKFQFSSPVLSKIPKLITFFSLQPCHFKLKVPEQLAVRRGIQKCEDTSSALDKECIIDRPESIWTHENFALFL